MAITEQHRHQLHKALEEILGAEEAATLMEYLPPVGWADVATKRDLDHLAAATKRDLDHLASTLRSEMQTMRHEFRAELHSGLNRVVLALVAAYASLTGLLLAGIKFA